MTLTHTSDLPEPMFMCPSSLTQMSIAAQTSQDGQFWSLEDSIVAGVVPLKDADNGRDDETDPLRDSPPSSNIERIGLSFKHMSVAPTPFPRTRKPEGISMNAGEYCKCFCLHVCASLSYSVIN